MLQKKAIKQVIIIPDGFTNSINFDLLQTDSIKQHSLSKSALINKYKFTYQTSGDALLKSYLPKNNYTAIELIMPSYKNSTYAPLNSSLQLFDNVLQNDFIIDRIKTNAIEVFEENNQLVQFVGHVKSNPNSYLPSLILTDSSQLSFSEFQGNLKGNSYLLNGCGSALGKVERFHKTNSFPYHLIDKGASSVICSLCN